MADKTIHFAANVNENGDVSALCFSAPRAINLAKASWALVPGNVTCPKCRALMAEKMPSTIYVHQAV